VDVTRSGSGSGGPAQPVAGSAADSSVLGSEESERATP
jgi:hypothetical protein